MTKYKVKSPIKEHSDFNLSRSLPMTHDFGHNQPLQCLLLDPDDKMNLRVDQFTRLMPMPAPTYGNILSNTRCFRVDMLSIFPRMGEFYSFSQSGQNSGVHAWSHVPFFTINDFVRTVVMAHNYHLSESFDPDLDWRQSAYQDLLVDLTQQDVNNGAKFDVVYYETHSDLSVEPHYYKFNYLGKRWFNILRGLGYDFAWAFFSEDVPPINSEPISLLPLFGYLKIYLDYYVPSRYYFDEKFDLLRKFWEYASTEVSNLYEYGFFSQSANSESVFSTNYFFNIVFNSIFASAYYTDDYFMTLLYSQSGTPNGLQVSPVQAEDMANSIWRQNGSRGDSPGNNSGDVEYYAQDGRPEGLVMKSEFHYFSLLSMSALQDMLTNGLVSSSKIQDYFKNTYGIDINYDELHLSQQIGDTKTTVVRVGDIPATASSPAGPDGSPGSYQGEYAGRGIIDNGKGDFFTYDNKDRLQQFVFVFNELLPYPLYGFGLDPVCSETKALNYYHPHLDGIGYEGVPLSRMVASFKSNNANFFATALRHLHFDMGYAPTYSRWKHNFDKVIGDFAVPSINTGLDSWYLDRDWSPDALMSLINANNGSPLISILYQLAWAEYDDNNYDRIFQDTDVMFDHFYSHVNLDIHVWSKKLPESLSLTYSEQSRTITNEVNPVNDLKR